jgi:hypothetical protein
VILEGDALQVVQALKKEGVNRSKIGHLIEETRELLQTLHSWCILHVCRHLNEAAHRLAREALSIWEEFVLIEEIPPCIADIVYVERCN